MLNFDFLKKCLGIVSPTHFVNDFLRKMFVMYILLTFQISLSDCLLVFEILDNSALKSFISQIVTL